MLPKTNPGHGDEVLPFSKIRNFPLTEEALGKLGRSLALDYLADPTSLEEPYQRCKLPGLEGT